MMVTPIPRSVLILCVALAAALAASACVPKPRAQYSPDQIQTLQETKELMRVLYWDLSPVWDSDKKASFTPADFATMSRVAPRVSAVSRALQSQPVRSRYKPGFADPAVELGRQAAALAKAAAAAAQQPARLTIKGINATCKSCHSRYK